MNPAESAPDFDAPEGIRFSPDVAVEFHPGAARGVWWGTLRVGRDSIEVGTSHGAHDLDGVLTMVAGILLERSHWADDTFISDDGSERCVLIGSWVLSARLPGEHVHYGKPELALDVFRRRAGRL